jgi:hypothetical protein
MDEIEAEGATALPDKEVMSLLDVNANVDLGLDLAAPVDLAAAANLNVAAPIEAAASANVLSDGAQATSIAVQHGSIDQSITGSADATAQQDADMVQTGEPVEAVEAGADGTAAATPVAGSIEGVTGAAEGTTGAVEGTAPAVGEAVEGTTPVVGDAVGDATDGVSGGVDSLLAGGSLLDANVDIDADADVTAPVNGAVAANANVAAPIDAAVAANIGSDGAIAQSLAEQQVDIHQTVDADAEATAQQDASIEQ